MSTKKQSSKLEEIAGECGFTLEISIADSDQEFAFKLDQMELEEFEEETYIATYKLVSIQRVVKSTDLEDVA